MRAIQYSRGFLVEYERLWNTGSSSPDAQLRTRPDDDTEWLFEILNN
jgi:hypothetical protein